MWITIICALNALDNWYLCIDNFVYPLQGLRFIRKLTINKLSLIVFLSRLGRRLVHGTFLIGGGVACLALALLLWLGQYGCIWLYMKSTYQYMSSYS